MFNSQYMSAAIWYTQYYMWKESQRQSYVLEKCIHLLQEDRDVRAEFE